MRIGGFLLTCLGVLLVALGLLFLVGSAGQASRYLVALVGLGLGAVLAGLGLRLVRGARALDPDTFQAEILALAQERSGELSEDDLRAALGTRWPEARPILDGLRAAGTCRFKDHEGSNFWVFPDLQARLSVRRCPYCGAEVPLESQASSCPGCGGALQTGVERVGLTEEDGFYGMDD